MDKLWAPWRAGYILGKKAKGCLFCSAIKSSGKKDYLVFKTRYSFCLMNSYPYNCGHLMVSPKSHVKDLADLPEPELLDLMKALLKAKELLVDVLKPEGFNIGINLGRVAGAGIPGHVHIHIVPRWNGDTNFMPVVARTKVISQSLAELQKQLIYAYAKTN